MPITTLFRTILIAGLITAIFSLVAGISLADTLPAQLQNYIAQTQADDISTTDAIMGIVGLVVIFVLLPISTIGLWSFKRWARSLYVVLTILFLPFYPIVGPIILNGWEAMFGDVSLILEGILIAMMFTGDIANKFEETT